jgi:hypothetical protein
VNLLTGRAGGETIAVANMDSISECAIEAADID